MLRDRRPARLSDRRARRRGSRDHLLRQLRRPLRLSRLLYRAARPARPWLWIAHLERGDRACGARTVGLDGVVAQQENYKKSGFVLAYPNIRYGGRVAATAAPPAGVVALDGCCIPAPGGGRRYGFSGAARRVPARVDRNARACRPRAHARRQARRLGRDPPLPHGPQDRAAGGRRPRGRRSPLRRAGWRRSAGAKACPIRSFSTSRASIATRWRWRRATVWRRCSRPPACIPGRSAGSGSSGSSA